MCYFRGIYFNTSFHFLAEHSVISHHHLHLHKTEFKTPIFYKTAPSWCRFYHHIRTPHEKRFLNYNVLSRWDKNLNNVVRSNKHNPIINALKYAPHKSASIQQVLMKKTTLLLSVFDRDLYYDLHSKSRLNKIWYQYFSPDN